MAKTNNNVKTLEWKDIVEFTASESGFPKKQIEETMNAVDTSLQKLLGQNQPKKVGDRVEFETPLGLYRTERLGATQVIDVNGQKQNRPECIAINFSVRNSYIDAANIGLIDESAIQASA